MSADALYIAAAAAPQCQFVEGAFCIFAYRFGIHVVTQCGQTNLCN